MADPNRMPRQTGGVFHAPVVECGNGEKCPIATHAGSAATYLRCGFGTPPVDDAGDADISRKMVLFLSSPYFLELYSGW